MRKKRLERRANRLCIVCGAREPMTKRVSCEKCLNRKRLYNIYKTAKKRAIKIIYEED